MDPEAIFGVRLRGAVRKGGSSGRSPSAVGGSQVELEGGRRGDSGEASSGGLGKATGEDLTGLLKSEIMKKEAGLVALERQTGGGARQEDGRSSLQAEGRVGELIRRSVLGHERDESWRRLWSVGSDWSGGTQRNVGKDS
ncbi:uncharacterized protein A4U43_C07F22020 [Asparagus officinalis]|uniref:Uncharacterized protein n=1 Tax=Asparagus officinalis TaxID=4686 RepID=A0A5P1EE32_ASPOF|nr:uncharacterized protein A4U43_C07F22020 [Asparagus officinalis]